MNEAVITIAEHLWARGTNRSETGNYSSSTTAAAEVNITIKFSLMCDHRL